MGAESKHRRPRGRQQSVLIEVGDELWYKYAQQYPEYKRTVDDKDPKKKNPSDLVAKYRTQATELYRQQVENHSQSKDQWLEAATKKGTLKDRIAAISVVISTDPVHRLDVMDKLLDYSKANSRISQLAAEALEDLFLSTLLPDDRNLISLSQRPLARYETKQHSLSPRILVLWYYEEIIKEKYELFLRSYLAKSLQDSNLEIEKISALKIAGSLLRAVPEGESFNLNLIVNKLGDPARKVAAAAAHELRKTLLLHNAMQQIVAREVQQLVHRPHLSRNALYNCIVFLNQLQLVKGTSLPSSLIQTYFRLFELAISKKQKDNDEEEGVKSRLLSALLAGVNRAHPYLPASDRSLDQHVDALYKICHTAASSARTQALLLLFHVTIGETSSTSRETTTTSKERFYRALYSILSNEMMTGKHLTMFFNLLYKSIKYDTETARMAAFCKKILSLSLHASSSVAAASLFLVHELGKEHSVLMTMYHDVLTGPNAFRIVDPTKREPRGALVSPLDNAPAKAGDERLAPGWEVTLYTHHFHPSVQKFATLEMIDNYTGDPLKDFSLNSFLDKFAYRNPKSAERVAAKYKRGQSVAERRSGTDSLVQSHFALPVNDPSFVEQRNVSVQDEFFHKFFVERAKRDQVKGIVRHHHADEKEQQQPEQDAEQDALDKDEEEMDPNFDEIESRWESDEEEEAFVDSLAVKLMKDGDSANGPGPADLDDEDPDMEGWDDMYVGREEDDVNGVESDSEGDDNVNGFGNAEEDDDDDAFMEEDSDSDVEPTLDENDAFPGEVEEHEEEEEDDDDEALGRLLQEDSSSDDDEAPRLVPIPSADSTFADADDYADLIAESWKHQKRGHDDEEPASKKKKSKKRRNKR